jgi:hypothetical protein
MPGRNSEHVKNIALSLILTLVTCGLYNIYWQYQQILTLNDMLKEDKYHFWPWLLLSLVTCGLYHVYHEYRLSEDIAKVCGRENRNDGLIAIVLSVFGLSFIVDAIQQSHINAYYGDDSL